jgi:acyl CoA:acetate/3-ketoacid CoA transferase alpha subunit/acyl CoA:acetate/3-ketoacid CoA transferase beta subunit
MNSGMNDFFQDTFQLKENKGENKVVGLSEAIKKHVRPGILLHIGEGTNAAILELIRAFQGKQADFAVIICGFSFYAMDLVASGRVKKLLTSFAGELYPTPGKNYLFSRAYREKKVAVELWSLQTIAQRLMAGAQDVPFLPTRSLEGTAVAKENADSYLLMADPFGSKEKIGLVKALRPDLSIVHGLAADCSGNTILFPQVVSGEGAWGALASKNGVIVTVEKVVPAHIIRKYAYLVKIPGYLVKAVSLAPLGMHPQGLANYGLGDFPAYYDDYDFQVAHLNATRDVFTYQQWFAEWVNGCPTHNDYLNKLGAERISELQRKAKENPLDKLLEILKTISTRTDDWNSIEMMIVAAARKIRERIRKGNYQVILCGIGASGLAAWLAYYLLKKTGRKNVEITLGSGFYGLAPRPGDPFIISLPTIATSKYIGGVTDAYGVIVCGANRKSISVLAGGQVDKYGNINSAKISDDIYLTGPGGAGDAYQAQETILVMTQSKERFLERLPYITSSGKTVKTLVSDLGIFEKLERDEELILTEYFLREEEKTEERIKKIKENCGWKLKISPQLKKASLPVAEELILLRLFDPQRQFLGKN